MASKTFTKINNTQQEIVKAEKIEATKEDIESKVEELANRMGKKVAEVKKTMNAKVKWDGSGVCWHIERIQKILHTTF